jgi:glycyl-tRNA synthetase
MREETSLPAPLETKSSEVGRDLVERKATYDEVLRLALERGFFYPTAEIYNDALGGFWDYGPLGFLLKNNIIQEWRRWITTPEEMLEIDGALILPKSVFEASGHLSSLVDPIVECTKCHTRLRADKYIAEKTGLQIDERRSPEEFQQLIIQYNLRCPKCDGELGTPSKFNMMFRVGVGAENADAYLRPETAQSIFTAFSRLSKTQRLKLPKGIAQVGKSFRNEIAPRQSLLRLRELIQAEVEIFFNPARAIEKGKIEKMDYTIMHVLRESSPEIEKVGSFSQAVEIFGSETMAYHFALLQRFYTAIGFPLQDTRFRELSAKDRAFYTSRAFDFEVNSSLGWIELVACNYRTDYDLSSHGKGSKQDLAIMDGEAKVLPHVVELSLGVDRTLFLLLDRYFVHETNRDVLRLMPNIAPYLAAVFPLISKPPFDTAAREIYEDLRGAGLSVFYDDSGAIGRRYRRMDEAGTPFCITVDPQTIQDNTVTLRKRDSMEQERVSSDQLQQRLYSLKYQSVPGAKSA